MNDWRERYDAMMENVIAGVIDAASELYRIQGASPFRERLTLAGRDLLEAQALRMENNLIAILGGLAVGSYLQIGRRRYMRSDQFTVLATNPTASLEIPQRDQS